ncbi:hypothetical protein, partial [Neisseria meningitidis]
AYFFKNVVFLQHNSSADLVRADALLPGCSLGFLKRHKKTHAALYSGLTKTSTALPHLSSKRTIL